MLWEKGEIKKFGIDRCDLMIVKVIVILFCFLDYCSNIGFCIYLL